MTLRRWTYGALTAAALAAVGLDAAQAGDDTVWGGPIAYGPAPPPVGYTPRCQLPAAHCCLAPLHYRQFAPLVFHAQEEPFGLSWYRADPVNYGGLGGGPLVGGGYAVAPAYPTPAAPAPAAVDEEPVEAPSIHRWPAMPVR